MHLISSGGVVGDGVTATNLDRAKTLLLTLPWTEIRRTNWESQPVEYEKLVAILHTLANQTVGLFYVHIRAYRTRHDWSSNDMAFPPTPGDIPFQSMMEIPDLFCTNSLTKFSLCHVTKMATPEFFEDGRWTGYDCTFLAHYRDLPIEMDDHVDRVGRYNNTVAINRWDEQFFLSPRIPGRNPLGERVERQARFRLLSWIDDRFFIVQSNCFQTSSDVQFLRLKVDSLTGIITILRHGCVTKVFCNSMREWVLPGARSSFFKTARSDRFSKTTFWSLLDYAWPGRVATIVKENSARHGLLEVFLNDPARDSRATFLHST